ETIEVASENVFKLAAFALQEAKGDYSSAETTASNLKQLPVLPTRVLREHPSLNYWSPDTNQKQTASKPMTAAADNS
ncbi:FERM domain-containing protein 4B, partial [Ataeniobius toweri]|nr:FERM domain-containing protein 4B [Ataeniobius toweri]